METYEKKRLETKKRVLILCGDDAPAIAAANAYAEAFKDHEVRFVEERVLSLKRILTFSRRRLKRLGFFSLLGVYMFYVFMFARRAKKPVKKYLPSLVVKAVSEDQAVELLIKQFKPDVIIIGFCGLLTREFLQKTGQNIYNTHPGINPRYRGFGNIWAFYENDFSNIGYTIHLVDAGIDTGKRIALEHVSFAGIKFAETDAYVAGLAARHLASLILGQTRARIPQEFSQLESRCYGVPTLATYYIARRNYNRYQTLTALKKDRNHDAPANNLKSGTTRAQKMHSSTHPAKQRHILITGASGGLGQALALEYARPDCLLSLWGRDVERLKAVAAACAAKGAQANYAAQDMRETEKTRERLKALDAANPVDLAVINAGISSGVSPAGEMESPEDVCRLFEVNATGAVNVASTLLRRMRARESGQVVLISSLAAYFPLPASPAYSAGKAALLSYARAMNMAMAQSKVRVSVVCPGYVDTAMSRRLKGAQPLRWSAPKAAAHIRRRLESGADHVSFPWPLALGIRCLNFLPRFLATFFVGRFSFTIEPDAESPQALQRPGTCRPPSPHASSHTPPGWQSSTNSPAENDRSSTPETKHE